MADQQRETTPWGAILALAVTVMMAFGVILYGFSIFVTGGAAGADFSKTVLSAAYGGSVVTGGLLAIPIGMRADRAGVRGLLALGGLMAGAGLWLFGVATEPWQVLIAWWLLIGPAGAMTFYEVAFIALDQWCRPRDRPRALGVLTLVGGLAGIIFIPVTELLVDWLEWRRTAFVLGGLVAATALFSSGVALRGLAAHSLRNQAAPRGSLRRRLLGDRRFTIHTTAMVLTFFAVQGIIAHRVAVFDEAGFDVGTVALWAAAASAFSLPGRWVAPLLATRFGAPNVQAAATLLLVVGTVLMIDGSQQWQMSGHFVFFGVAFGAFLPLRAMTMAEWFSGARYGATMGSQWTAVTILGALGPVVVGLLRDSTSGYRAGVMAVGGALAAGTALLVVVSRLREPVAATSDPTRLLD